MFLLSCFVYFRVISWFQFRGQRLKPLIHTKSQKVRSSLLPEDSDSYGFLILAPDGSQRMADLTDGDIAFDARQDSR